MHAPGFTPRLSHVWEFEWVGPAAKNVAADSHGSDDKVVWGEALGPDVCRAQFVVRTLVHLPFGLGAIEAAAIEGRVRQCGPGALTVIELRLPPWVSELTPGQAARFEPPSRSSTKAGGLAARHSASLEKWRARLGAKL